MLRDKLYVADVYQTSHSWFWERNWFPHDRGDTRTEISDFFLFCQKNPFSEYMFPKLTLDGPISINFSQNLEK